jgi:hypothetical protein
LDVARKIFSLSFSPIENPYYNGGLGAGAWWFRMGIMWALLLGGGRLRGAVVDGEKIFCNL